MLAMQSSPSDIARITGELRAAVELSRAAVEELLQVRLAPGKATEHWVAFTAEPAEGPFAQIEFRESKSKPWRLVNLTVRSGVDIRPEQLRGTAIPPDLVPTANPRVSPEGQLEYRLDERTPKQETYFAFGAESKLLRTVSVQRNFE